MKYQCEDILVSKSSEDIVKIVDFKNDVYKCFYFNFVTKKCLDWNLECNECELRKFTKNELRLLDFFVKNDGALVDCKLNYRDYVWRDTVHFSDAPTKLAFTYGKSRIAIRHFADVEVMKLVDGDAEYHFKNLD